MKLVKKCTIKFKASDALKAKINKFKMTKDYLDITELSVKLNLINKKTGKPANYILRFWEKEFSGY